MDLAPRPRLVPLEPRLVQLEEAGMLHGPAHEALRRSALAEFRALPARPASCAGGAYPSDAEELRAFLDGFLEEAAPSPTLLPGGQEEAGRSPGHGVRLLVAPHIDLHRGGASYGHAYRALQGCDAELFVVFGTAHASPPHPFTLTRLD